jgi:hypothetical protein
MRKQLTVQDLINGTAESSSKIRKLFSKELEKQSKGLPWKTVEEIRKDLEKKKG